MNHARNNLSSTDLLDHLPLGIVVLDRDGAITYSNESAMRILEIDLYDLVEKHLFDIFKDDKLEFALTSLHSGITERSLSELKIRNRIINVTLKNLDTSRFGTGSILVILEDISKFRELESIKTDFVSTLLHRLRTPLTTIKSSLSFLAHVNPAQEPQEVSEIIDMCHSETNRLIFFMNDLRDLFLIEAGLIEQTMAMSLVPLASVLEKAISAIGLQAREKNIQLKYDKDAWQAVVEVDEERLVQAITNILSNAVTFTPERGSITITLTNEEETVRLSVTDTGIGISESDLSHIFEKHFRADNEITRNVIGYGLGLYIAKYLIELFKGKIYAYSELGRGTQFDVVFQR
jgi:two-component system, OmpR family, phosphate regulon sensor histidine kinase PhoR